MAGDRSRYGLLVSALGAIAARGVCVPAVVRGELHRRTASRVAQQAGDQAAAQFGNAALQAHWASSTPTSRARRPSARGAERSPGAEAPERRAAGARRRWRSDRAAAARGRGSPRRRSRRRIAGRSRCSASLAAAVVLFRIVDPPAPAGGVLALSLREGAWLALLGSLAMIAGGAVAAHARRSRRPSEAKLRERLVGALRLDARGQLSRAPADAASRHSTALRAIADPEVLISQKPIRISSEAAVSLSDSRDGSPVEKGTTQ